MYTPGLVPARSSSSGETPSDGLELTAWLQMVWSSQRGCMLARPRCTPGLSTVGPLLSSPPLLAAPSRPGQMAMVCGVAAG